MNLKTFLSTALLMALALPATAQHKTTLYDSTSVVMEESGLSHVINHQRIRANDFDGCRDLATLKVDYDPLSAYVEFRQVLVHHISGAHLSAHVVGDDEHILRGLALPAGARQVPAQRSQRKVKITISFSLHYMN